MAKNWENKPTGPDWTDIGQMMDCLGTLHKSSVYLEMCVDGSRGASALNIRLLIVRDAPVGEGVRAELATSITWPNTSARTMEGTVLGLCYVLDNICLAEWWHQGNFIEA